MKNNILYLLMIFFLFSCKREELIKISLKEQSKFDFKEERIYITLIKSFENNKSCSKENLNANVYICKDIHTNDTIIVFEPCQKMPDFAKNNYNGERDLTIEKTSLISEKSQSFIVSSDFRYKTNQKYIIGSLTRLLY